MSDLVRYISGNTVGRDHLWGATILRSEIATYTGFTDSAVIDRVWPVDITLAQAMAIYWRVKKWKVNGSISVSLDYVAGSVHITGDASGSLTERNVFSLDGDLDEVTREQDILSIAFEDEPFKSLGNAGIGNTAAAGGFNWTANTHETGGGDLTESSTNNGAISFLSLPYALYDPMTQMFSPPNPQINFVNGTPAIIGGTILNLFLVNVQITRNPQTVLAGTGPILLRKPGKMTVKTGVAADFDIPLELTWRLTFEATGSTISAGVGSADFTMEAIEWWPYKTTTGLPVYNSGSGAQINSPFT